MFNVLEISRLTLHNGPGYRTNVHFMGCPLRCRWCSTPESQKVTGLGLNPHKCIGCGYCAKACPEGAISFGEDGKALVDRSRCSMCFRCTEECYANAFWKIGEERDFDSLFQEIIQDELFFKNSGGGITFSGGECLMNVSDEMVDLYKAVADRGIQIGVDTCGCVPWRNIEVLLPYIRFFLWDIKKMDPEEHKRLTGRSNELIFSNLEKVSAESNAEIYIRYPVIPGINDSEADIHALCEYLLKLPRFNEVHYLPFHKLGISRYEYSGIPYQMGETQRPSAETLQRILEITNGYGIPCKIVG